MQHGSIHKDQFPTLQSSSSLINWHFSAPQSSNQFLLRTLHSFPIPSQSPVRVRPRPWSSICSLFVVHMCVCKSSKTFTAMLIAQRRPESPKKICHVMFQMGSTKESFQIPIKKVSQVRISGLAVGPSLGLCRRTMFAQSGGRKKSRGRKTVIDTASLTDNAAAAAPPRRRKKPL